MARTSLLTIAALTALSAGGCISPLVQQPGAGSVASAPTEPVPIVPAVAARAERPRRSAAAIPAPPPAAAPNTTTASWQMPWQLTPVGTAPEQAGETIVLSYVPQVGFMRGTSAALGGVGHPLEAAAGPNRTVDTCRQTVWGEASKSGATEVEAVSAGAEQRDRKGDYFAPVRMRVTYQRPSGWEVRTSTLTCIVDRRGKIVDAYT